MSGTLYSNETTAVPQRDRSRDRSQTHVLLNAEEREALKLAAATAGLSLSAWLRSLAFAECRRLGIDVPKYAQ